MTVAQKAWWEEREVIASVVRKPRGGAWFLLMKSAAPAHGMVPPLVGYMVPQITYSRYPLSHAHVFVSKVILDPVKLTISRNHSASVSSEKEYSVFFTTLSPTELSTW